MIYPVTAILALLRLLRKRYSRLFYEVRLHEFILYLVLNLLDKFNGVIRKPWYVQPRKPEQRFKDITQVNFYHTKIILLLIVL